ncbi:MAG TPA: hypothetical protein VML75_02425 [Kofleriaceae bacterium]|nr:hypothetical protein [Kofleriaceae bacterium]
MGMPAGVRAQASGDSEAGVNVTLDVAACVQTDAASVRRLFLLELGTSRREAPPPGDSAGALVEIDCSGELLELRVHDRLTGKHLLRRIAPGPAAGRDRMLALAVMELLVASWIELETTPEPAVRAADSPADARGASTARELARRRLPKPRARTRSTLSVFGGAQRSGPWRVGGGARLTRAVSPRYGWSAELAASRGDTTVPEGEVDLTSATAAGALLVGTLRGQVRAYGGAGVRAARVSIQGRSQRPDVRAGSVSGFTAGPFARAGIDVTVRGSLTLGVTLDGGVDLIRVRGLVDGRDDLGAGRTWIGADVGAGWTF